MEYIIDITVLFNKGGLIMYPLLICSVIAVAIVIERCLHLRAAKTNLAALLPRIEDNLKKGDWVSAAKIAAGEEGAAALMLSQALSRPVSSRGQMEQMFEASAARISGGLRRRINYLDTIVTLAPLLGLLGTVNGMIRSFSVLNVVSGQPLAITGGIGEALIATAAGLCVAIAALIFHSFLNNQIEDIINQMEETANAALAALTQGDGEAV